MGSRREFFTHASGLVVATSVQMLAAPPLLADDSLNDGMAALPDAERVSLDGAWQFQFDPEASGDVRNLQDSRAISSDWKDVAVPHTWQIVEGSTEYYGAAWYRRVFDVRSEWKDRTIRIEFEAVFHSATVWVNGREAGKHLRKGYTAFSFDITPLLRFGAENTVVVKVNNQFDDAMLPRGRSSDWTHDGGIYRPVSLLVTPKVYIERVDVEAVPELKTSSAELQVTVIVRNSGTKPWKGQIGYAAIDATTGVATLAQANAASVALKPGEQTSVSLPKNSIRQAKLWHFDHPYLYRLIATISGSDSSHQFTTTFGVRSIEVKDAGFYLNGERVRLMGVERMAGSNPEFGMAEPASWIDHDHDDLKALNCVFTRVHWPQDKRVLDYCDRHGILIQSEVPTWGADTFKGMHDQPAPEIMENGLEQLREMVARDRNHPCIFSWGLCNEIGGQNAPAYNFAKRMYEEAKRLDPRRLRSYASNSLQSTPGKDVSSLMDFVEWNEYYETWYRGTPESVRRNLEEIGKAFPGKPVVISEYGYCACTLDRPEGDQRRIEILRDHTRVFRESEFIGGLIFFCYNDYRTHYGDKGSGVVKQRVHGVVDLYGARKPSYEVLRDESAPIQDVKVEGQPAAFNVTVRTRGSAPSYTLTNYKLRAILYGFSDIPLERREVELPVLSPGKTISIPVKFTEAGAVRIVFDVCRPTGFSAYTRIWKP